MRQRAEKYARGMERRVESLEARLETVETDMSGHEQRLSDCEAKLTVCSINMQYGADRWEQMARRNGKLARQRAKDLEKTRLLAAILLTILLTVMVMLVYSKIGGDKLETESSGAGTVSAKVEAEEPVILLTGNVVDFPARYSAASAGEQARIAEALEAQGYFSEAVPMCREYQDYMRTYSRKYGCPYQLALAVAEAESDFDMDAVGAVGEVGIMQLNPGPDGAYHKELEEETGLDTTTPEGNIAGGCYLLGKYLQEYGSVTMAAMAYSMGQAGAEQAREAGIISTTYADGVLEAMERWECLVNAWNGE